MKRNNRVRKDEGKEKKEGSFSSLGDLLLEYDYDKKKYISQEFQDYGYRLAMELKDEKNKSLYIKLAKTEDRALLEQARTFLKDARNVRSKVKMFMWVLAKLRKGEPLYDEEKFAERKNDYQKDESGRSRKR